MVVRHESKRMELTLNKVVSIIVSSLKSLELLQVWVILRVFLLFSRVSFTFSLTFVVFRVITITLIFTLCWRCP